VNEPLALRRAEIALALLGLMPLLLASVFVVDAIAYHGREPEPQLAFAVLSAVVLVRALASLARQLRAERAFLRRLPVVRAATIHGYEVLVVRGRASHAFCAGLLRPAVHVSDGLLRAGEAEVLAVLAHEEQHRARRDPLRQLLARTIGDALRPLPPFAGLAERQAVLADLVADTAAVRALGDRAALASAMVLFDYRVAPARVDRLLGTARAITIPTAVLATSSLFLVVPAAAHAGMAFTGWHLGLTLPILLESLALIAISAPACLAARRVAVS
jgi:peptidase M48-like protein